MKTNFMVLLRNRTLNFKEKSFNLSVFTLHISQLHELHVIISLFHVFLLKLSECGLGNLQYIMKYTFDDIMNPMIVVPTYFQRSRIQWWLPHCQVHEEKIIWKPLFRCIPHILISVYFQWWTYQSGFCGWFSASFEKLSWMCCRESLFIENSKIIKSKTYNWSPHKNSRAGLERMTDGHNIRSASIITDMMGTRKF
jgi:hypothetical protein